MCEYFLKLSEAERAKSGPYPHEHLHRKYITTNKDSQLRGTSRNGQYSSRFTDVMYKMDMMKRFIGLLAEQNNVSAAQCVEEIKNTGASQGMSQLPVLATADAVVAVTSGRHSAGSGAVCIALLATRLFQCLMLFCVAHVLGWKTRIVSTSEALIVRAPVFAGEV